MNESFSTQKCFYVLNGTVVLGDLSNNPHAVKLPLYDSSKEYRPGDFCEYENKAYMRNSKVSYHKISGFDMNEWCDAPIFSASRRVYYGNNCESDIMLDVSK